MPLSTYTTCRSLSDRDGVTEYFWFKTTSLFSFIYFIKDIPNMGLGVLEPKGTIHVAGTVLLNDESTIPGLENQRLKHATGVNKHIVLAPQPSDDPNDPLNWSTLEKHTIIGVLCFGSIVCSAVLVSQSSPLGLTTY
jgi:hypothetical protein